MDEQPKARTPFVGRRMAANCPKCSHKVAFEIAGYLHIDGIRYMPLEIFEAWVEARPKNFVMAEWTPVARMR